MDEVDIRHATIRIRSTDVTLSREPEIVAKAFLVGTVLVLGLFCLALGARHLQHEHVEDPASRIDPRLEPWNGTIGSDACLSCHPYQHATWHRSYHRTMTQVATPTSVQAPFDGTELDLEGITWQLEQRGEDFWVAGNERLPNSDQFLEFERRIVMTTGSHNYQMYWMESVGERGMQPFPLVFLLYDRIWIPRKSRFLTPPVDRSPSEAGRWSVHCIKCHATRGQPEAPGGGTRVSELGISCEACHGPGSEHARRNRSPLRRFSLYLGNAPDGNIVNPSRLAHDRSTQVCGQCHSIELFLTQEQATRWRHQGSQYRPGDDLLKFQTIVAGRYEDNSPAMRRHIEDHPVFRLRNCFWPDGMVRVTGREYHGMRQSPCFQRGEMSCLSCHRLHRDEDDPRSLPVWAEDQLDEGMRGDRACVQCHASYEEPGAVAAHSHHPVDSAGSRCQNCHSSYTTWGLLRAIRSHTVDSPDVATTVATGRPNACNQCHLDRTLGWTAGKLQEWYGIEPPELSYDEKTVAASILWALSGDAVQRALMAWSMGWEPAREASGTEWMVPYLCLLLVDPYDAVRFRAQSTLRLYPEYRTIAGNQVRGATLEEQDRMKDAIFSEWQQRFPHHADRSGPRFLIDARADIDQVRFGRFVALRRTYELSLFE